MSKVNSYVIWYKCRSTYLSLTASTVNIILKVLKNGASSKATFYFKSTGISFKQIEKVSGQLPEISIFESVPEVSAQAAAQLIGEFSDIEKFDNANQLDAYDGIDISRVQSRNQTRTDYTK